MIRILQVTSSFQRGGTEAYVMNNFRNIDRSGFAFDFWVFLNERSPYEEEIRSLGGGIYHGQVPRVTHLIEFIRELYRHLRTNGPYDVVHAHVDTVNSWVMVAALLAGVRTRVSHAHAAAGGNTRNPVKKTYRLAQRWLINACSTDALACSAAAGNHLYGPRQFRKHGEVVRNGIDAAGFSDVDDREVAATRRHLDIPGDHFVLGNVSRFDRNKNPRFTVRVFQEVLRERPDSVLVLGGNDGGELEAVKRLVRAAGIEEKVRSVGVRSDLAVVLHVLDAYVFPSHSEGLGLAIVEAQAAGLPSYAATGVPRDADVGLGLVTFLDLRSGPEYWAARILAGPRRTLIDRNTILSRFDETGYSIAVSVRRIEQIYRGRS